MIQILQGRYVPDVNDQDHVAAWESYKMHHLRVAHAYWIRYIWCRFCTALATRTEMI